jgi:hypothetical protein
LTPQPAKGYGPGTTPALTVERAQALLTEGLYYNAHSAAFPGGEIRGQLRATTAAASGN